MSIKRQRIRMACDPGKDESPLDLITGERPAIRRAADLQFEFSLLWAGVLQSIADVASITLEVRATRKGAAVIQKQVLVSAMDATTDAATWSAGTKQHATVIFTNEETAGFDLGNDTTNEFWLIVSCLTTTGEVYDWTYGAIDVIEIGLEATAAPAPGDPTYYTQAQIDALLAAITGGNTAFNSLRIWNPTTSTYVLAQPYGSDPNINWTFQNPAP